MSLNNCLTKTKEFVKEQGLDRKLPPAYLESFARRLSALGSDSLTPAEFKLRASEMLEQDVKRSYAAYQADKLMTIVQSERAHQAVMQNIADWKESYGDKTKWVGEAVRVAIEGGSVRPGKNVWMDPKLLEQGFRDKVWDIWNEGYKRLKGIADQGILDRETFIERYALATGGRLGTSGSESALEYAKTMMATQNALLKIEQAYNPRLESAQGYVGKAFHDADRIGADPSDGGKQAWLDQVMKTYGKNFAPELTLEQKQVTFMDTYNKILSGTHGSVYAEGKESSYLDLNKSMAKSKQWIAETPELEWEYQSKYGPRTIAEGMARDIDSSARNLAIMSKFTARPEEWYDRLFNRLYQDLDPKDVRALRDAKPGLDEKFKALTGARSQQAGLASSIASGMMQWNYLTKTSGAIFHVMNDIPMTALMNRGLNGKSIFVNSAELGTSLGKMMLGLEDSRKVLGKAGIFLSSTKDAMMSELGAPGDGGTFAGRILQKVGNLNALRFWHEKIKAGESAVIMSALGDMSDKSFDGLSSREQQKLVGYGFTDNAWNSARLGAHDVSGNTWLSPDGVRSLPDEAIENYMRKDGLLSEKVEATPRMLDRGREELAQNLSLLIRDHATIGAAEMGSRQRNFLWGAPSSDMYVLRRMITQFKGASFTIMDNYRRAANSGEGMKSDYWGVMQAMGGVIAINVMAKTMKDLASGKTPEDPTTPHYAAQAFLESGVGGVYGGILANSLNSGDITSRGLNLATGIVGPALTTGVKAGAVASQFASEFMGGRKDRTLQDKAASLALENIPGSRTPLLKPVVDYYLTQGLHTNQWLNAMERGVHQSPAMGGGYQKFLFNKPSGKAAFEGE